MSATDSSSEVTREELAALRSATRDFLARRTPTSVGDHDLGIWSTDDWRSMAEALGLQGVGVPEEQGGSGLGSAVQSLVHEEMGRALLPGPYLPTVAWVLPALRSLPDDPWSQALVARIAAGDAVLGSPALLEQGWSVLGRTPGGLTGVVELVREVDASDGVLLPVLVGDEPALVHLTSGDVGVEQQPLASVDITRPLWRVRLDGASPRVVATGQQAIDAVDEAERSTARALAAESVGVTGWAMESTVEYVAVRRQFGRPIGSFQAVKHQCADMLLSYETARAALAMGLSSGAHDDWAGLAAARIHCGRSAYAVAESAVHLHGGIGFTWEHRAHLYYRRAKVNEMLLNGRGDQHDVIVAALLRRRGALAEAVRAEG